jgi:hypothetical protein
MAMVERAHPTLSGYMRARSRRQKAAAQKPRHVVVNDQDAKLTKRT